MIDKSNLNEELTVGVCVLRAWEENSLSANAGLGN